MSTFDKSLPWVNTRYSMSLDCAEDLNFYLELLKRDPEAAAFFRAFHMEANTNDPKTDWGRARRSSRRRDIYHHESRLPYDDDQTS